MQAADRVKKARPTGLVVPGSPVLIGGANLKKIVRCAIKATD
jgi:hypothetical protein